MSIDRELQRRRRAAIRDIVAKGEPVPDLEELVKRLSELGIPATQANVRRVLKELEAERSGKLYIVPSSTEDKPPFERAQGWILRVITVESSMILIKTRLRAGPMVGAAIDESRWEELAGTIVGDSAVLLVCESQTLRDLLMDRLISLLDRYGDAARHDGSPDGSDVPVH